MDNGRLKLLLRLIVWKDNVIEIDGVTEDVKKEYIAEAVSAGDVLVFKEGKWHKDVTATEERTRHIKKLMDSVWGD